MISVQVNEVEYRVLMAFRKLASRYLFAPEYWQFVADGTPGTVYGKLVSKEKVSVSLSTGGLKVCIGNDHEL